MTRAEKIAARYICEGYLFHGNALDFIRAVGETKTKGKDGKFIRPQTAVLKMGGALDATPSVNKDLADGKLVKFDFEEDTVLTF